MVVIPNRRRERVTALHRDPPVEGLRMSGGPMGVRLSVGPRSDAWSAGPSHVPLACPYSVLYNGGMTTTAEATENGYHSTGWACVDCLFLLANGDTPDRMDEDETAAWLAEIDRVTEGLEVTLGLLADQHDEECPNIDHETMTWLGTSDCSCEDREFSWSSCDTCRSRLGGSRHAVTFWIPRDQRTS